MIEDIKDKTKRNLTEDQWSLVKAIKTNAGEDMMDSFQKYWQERCGNYSYLIEFDVWAVLESYAREMFDKTDWYRVKEGMRRTFMAGERLSALGMSEIYLSAIMLMQIYYDIKE